MRALILVGLLAAAATTHHTANAYTIKELKEGWTLGSQCGIFATMSDISVPSTIIAAQIENEMRKPAQQRTLPLADPFYGRNFELFNASAYQACGVEYTHDLDLSASSNEKKGSNGAATSSIYILRLHGVNYNANITINGRRFLSSETVIGGVRRFALDITAAMNTLNDNDDAMDNTPPSMKRSSQIRLGGKGAKKTSATASNLLQIALKPPVNPRNTDLAFSFLDWNPLPADFNGGLWRSVSLLELNQPITLAGAEQLYMWSNGFAVDTKLGKDGTSTTAPATVTIDAAVQCYPLEACTAALVEGPNAAAAQADFVKRVVFTTDYPTAPLKEVRGDGSTGAVCKISTPFARIPSRTASDVVKTVDGQPFVEGRVSCTVANVANPMLWYPFRRAYDFETGSDKPHLFHLTTNVIADDGSTLNMISEANKNFGLRQVHGNLSSANTRQLFINNEFILIAGAGWSPDMFLRIDEGTDRRGKLLRQLELTKHMGINTIRLEGKWENELFFNLCDEMGILVLPGIECCSSWQNWNLWNESMTEIARVSVKDQLRRLGSHPSMIAFLGSSDDIPPQSVEEMYTQLYAEERWSAAIIAAACAGKSPISGETGVKMSGPYSWVPPNYFLGNSDGNTVKLGGGWGFLTEGGPGESPMTYNAWKLTVPEEHLWETSADGSLTNANASLSDWWNAHAGLPKGVFRSLRRFTPPLNARFGEATSAKEYLFKAQLMNLEGIRAMFEAYTRNKIYNATGTVQWMLNNAYPSNIWHLYDYYLYGGGGYYGAKAALRPIHMVLSTIDGSVAIVSNDYTSHFGGQKGTAKRKLSAEWFVYRLPTNTADASKPPTIIASSGSEIFDANTFAHNTVVFMNEKINFTAINAQLDVNETYFVRLVYIVERDTADNNEFKDKLTSTQHVQDNWYWLSTTPDIVDWNYNGPSPWLYTDCLQWANFQSLEKGVLAPSNVSVTFAKVTPANGAAATDKVHYDVTVVNQGTNIVFAVQLAAYNAANGLEVAPSMWDDNYFTLMPNQKRVLRLTTLAEEDYTGAPISVARVEAISYNDIVSEKRMKKLL